MSNAPTLLTRSLTLPTYRLELLEATLKRLGKRAAKLGCVAPSYKLLGERVVDVSDTDEPRMVSFSDVEVAYEVLVVAGGWKFLASQYDKKHWECGRA